MVPTDKYEVPQSLLTKRPVPTLEMWIGVRCAIRRRNAGDTQTLLQPLVQTAAKRAAMTGLSVNCPRPSLIGKLPKDAIVVMN